MLDALFDLRGGSTTDLALGLRTAFAQLRDARAAQREVVVLTDGAWNEGEDPVPVVARSGVTVSVLRTVDSAEATRVRAPGGRRAAGGTRRCCVPPTRPPRWPPCCAEALPGGRTARSYR